ncbi:MAG: hypothetical protein HOU81_26855 [Hamadaea sp.]|uniref:hypothetical protein n=1 Tax=Hamadaea sp. TaxID=2024425 RepID=UPI0017CD96B5|nr:hypothetical protein [Hamadaea sp.]NUR74447.1 hypothetical protein [Hamadaea sp.]NUT18955.1 hypothetical protein [Hamadaea sp.]
MIKLWVIVLFVPMFLVTGVLMNVTSMPRGWALVTAAWITFAVYLPIDYRNVRTGPFSTAFSQVTVTMAGIPFLGLAIWVGYLLNGAGLGKGWVIMLTIVTLAAEAVVLFAVVIPLWQRVADRVRARRQAS